LKYPERNSEEVRSVRPAGDGEGVGKRPRVRRLPARKCIIVATTNQLMTRPTTIPGIVSKSTPLRVSFETPVIWSNSNWTITTVITTLATTKSVNTARLGRRTSSRSEKYSPVSGAVCVDSCYIF